MRAFLDKHAAQIQSPLGCFDRLIFRGHLPLCRPEIMAAFLNRHNVLLKDFKQFVPVQAERLRRHAQTVAQRAGRPFLYQEQALRKEEYARALAAKDGLQAGLVCVFRTVEPCRSFKIVPGPHRPRLVSATRKCLFFYFYYLDREFGLMHIRIQSWFPFTVQVYINGHEWLARKMDRHGLAYQQADNAFLWLADPHRAQKFSDRLAEKNWPKVLDVLARRVNPLLTDLLAGYTYYWVTDQAEYALDFPFREPAALQRLYPHLLRHAALCFSAEDILRFLGRRLYPHFQGEVLNDLKKRPAGARVRHRMKANWIKMYDKQGRVLRIETVLNNPREFKVRRWGTRQGRRVLAWLPLNKGVANLRHYAAYARRACERYAEALAAVDDPTPAWKQLQRVCEKSPTHPRRRRGLNPLRADDLNLFRAVMRGEQALQGFRQREVRAALNLPRAVDAAEERRRSACASRRLQLLRAHGLIAKIPRSRRWRVTPRGQALMGSAVLLHAEFPKIMQRMVS